MKRHLSLVAALLAAIVLVATPLVPPWSTSLAQDDGVATNQRTVTVTGTGSVSGSPNLAIVTLGVETDAAEAAAALTENSEQMQEVIDALTGAGIAAADIQTRVVQLTPRYAQPEPTTGQVPPTVGSRGEVVGYTAVNMVEVRVRNLAQLGSVIDAGVGAGANRVEGIGFQIENPASLMAQAREAAWNNALTTAQQLASLAGANLGQVMTISESTTGPIPVLAEQRVGGAVPISPGTVNVETTVRVVWLLTGGTAPQPGATAQPGTTAQATQTASVLPLATMTVTGAPTTGAGTTPVATRTLAPTPTSAATAATAAPTPTAA